MNIFNNEILENLKQSNKNWMSNSSNSNSGFSSNFSNWANNLTNSMSSSNNGSNGLSSFQSNNYSSSSSGSSSNSVTVNGGEDKTNIQYEEFEPVDPQNPTDPIVVFDPKIPQTTVMRKYIEQEPSTAENAPGDYTDQDNTAIDGIKIPIICLNNSSIKYKDILEFKLSIKEFLPTLELKIYDAEGKLKAMDVPGMENGITVVLIAPIDGANKKISLDFYILECNFTDGGIVEYKAEMKLTNMHSKKNVQLGSEKLSTYEMLEEIAKQNDLGFAATEDCKGIEDKRWRQVYGQPFCEYIKEQLSFAGKDENSIFDAWVDEFGYLVMVNIAWVFNYTLDVKQLTIKTIDGINSGTKLEADMDVSLKETLRMISNQKSSINNENLRISNYTHDVDNNKLKDGTVSKYYYMTGLCESNTIEMHEGEIKELSIDAQSDNADYGFENIEFIGFDMTDDDDEDNTPIIVQEKNVSNFFNTIYAKTLNVTMTKPNYLLQRGTLILVDIEEFNSLVKNDIIDNAENSVKTEEDEKKIQVNENRGSAFEAKKEMFGNTMDGVPNFAKCGVYYIKDITFVYSEGAQEIMQQMTLVKRGMQNNINNMETVAQQ